MRVIVDGSTVRTEEDFHQSLARQLDFGEHYGHNLAALRDRLSTDVPRPVELVWTDSAASRDAMGEELFERIRSILASVQAQDAQWGLDERFTYSLE